MHSTKAVDSILFFQCLDKSGQAAIDCLHSVNNVRVQRVHNKKMLKIYEANIENVGTRCTVRNLLKGPLIIVRFQNEKEVIKKLQRLLNEHRNLFIPVGALMSGCWLRVTHFGRIKVQTDLLGFFHALLIRQLLSFEMIKKETS